MTEMQMVTSSENDPLRGALTDDSKPAFSSSVEYTMKLPSWVGVAISQATSCRWQSSVNPSGHLPDSGQSKIQAKHLVHLKIMPARDMILDDCWITRQSKDCRI